MLILVPSCYIEIRNSFENTTLIYLRLRQDVILLWQFLETDLIYDTDSTLHIRLEFDTVIILSCI